MDGNNPHTSAKKTVKIGDDVIIGFAPYDWGHHRSDIVTNLKTGGPAKQLSKANYHKLFTGVAATTERYVGLDTRENELYNKANPKSDPNVMNYKWKLYNAPCRDVDTDCNTNFSTEKYHPYSAQPQASRCNKTLGFCPKPI